MGTNQCFLFGIIGLVSSISSNGTGVTLVSKSSCDICRRIFKLGDEVAVVAAVAVAAPALFFAWIHFTNMENVIGAELRHQEIGQVYQHKISLTPIFT